MVIIKKIKPMLNGVITTINKYKADVKVTGTSLIDSTKAGSVKEYQTVVAVGPMVRDIKVGDIVYINPSRYAVKKHKEGSLKDGVITDNPIIGYDFDTVEIDGEPHLYLSDNDIKFIAEIEEFDENPTIVVPDKKVLL